MQFNVMYVCMHVCMHVCMYVCVYLCMYVRTYVCMYTLKYTCIPQCIVFLIQGARSINKHQKNSKYRQRIWIKSWNHRWDTLQSSRLKPRWTAIAWTTSTHIGNVLLWLQIASSLSHHHHHHHHDETLKSWKLKIMKHHEKHETWKSRNHELRNMMTILHETWS